MLDAGWCLSFPVTGNAGRPADSFFTLAESTRFTVSSYLIDAMVGELSRSRVYPPFTCGWLVAVAADVAG